MTADQDSETYYDIYLDVEEKDGKTNYTAKDDFYKNIICKPYADYVMQKVTEVCSGCFYVKSQAYSVEDIDFDETMTVDEIVEGKLDLQMDNIIYVSVENGTEDKKESVAKLIEDKMRGEFKCGNYSIMIFEESPKKNATEDDIREFLTKDRIWNSLSVYIYRIL